MFLYLQVLINKKNKYKDKKIQAATQTKSGDEFKKVSISCLIQGITNCLQINTYWSYNRLVSNILLLASKKCFLSSQGLVGAGMNCRALFNSLFEPNWGSNL